MRCPYCDSKNTKVLDSRDVASSNKTRRRRECLNCGKRFSTMEVLMELTLYVIKRDGSEEQFVREKIMRGILKAGEKRPITLEQIDGIVNDIEKDAATKFEYAVPTSYIGEQVMKRLKELDEITYVRYASVYKKFKDIDALMKEIEELKSGNYYEE